ncbi:MAG: hypothetical protein J5I81_07850 [Nitrococcus mobilis]|nr:hypothetical protein [Nitrococcus mobilis]
MSRQIRFRRGLIILAAVLLAAIAMALVYARQIRAAKVDASAIVVQAQRLSAADTLYRSDHAGAPARDVAALIAGGYLSSPPRLPGGVAGAMKLDRESGLIHRTVADAAVCAEINGQLSADKSIPVAASSTSAALDDAIEMPYGCAAVVQPMGERTYHFIFH